MKNIFYINKYLNTHEIDFLENKDNKYVDICKKIYGANIDKLSIYLWTSHIMNDFNDKLIKNASEIYGIDKLSDSIYNLIKNYRKRLISYSYLKGVIFGNNDYTLIKEFKHICENIIKEKNKDTITKKELKELEEIKMYLNSIKIGKFNIENLKKLNETLDIFYLNSIKEEIKNSNLNCDKKILIKIINEIMRNDAINIYNEGILDGIIYKINKKDWKNNKIRL